MIIYLYKTFTQAHTMTHNGGVDNQVKFNPQNHLIYGQHCCYKRGDAREIITTWHRGEAVSVYK